jgi:hypothetical protein
MKFLILYERCFGILLYFRRLYLILTHVAAQSVLFREICGFRLCMAGLGLLCCFQELAKPRDAVAAEYFVDSWSGSDLNVGTSPGAAWKSLGMVNGKNFLPGDNIYLKRDGIWSEELVIPSSGSEDKPIVFGSYGFGSNPVIKTTVSFGDWTLYNDRNGKKVWTGEIKGLKSCWGAMVDGKRTPRYYVYNEEWVPPEDLCQMNDGFFYAPLKGGVFFMRNDEDKPRSMEVGVRKYGILVENKENVTIDGIDVTGPGGRWDGTSQEGFFLIMVDNCRNVRIINCTLSHHINGGATIRNRSTNCSYENVTSFGHGSTGLYFSEAGTGNRASGCHVYACGNLITDMGDMGLIGVWMTPGVTIDNCVLHDNGHPGMSKIDAGISFVRSVSGRVSRCSLKTIGGTGIQFAENSDYGSASYNIVDSWGAYGALNMNEGIRVGGGYSSSSAKGCRIYNNLFINGGRTTGRWAALRVLYRENEGLRVCNNIFYNNSGVFEVIAESRDGFRDWVFSNNCYFRTEGGPAIEFDGKRFEIVEKGIHVSSDLKISSSRPLAAPTKISVIGGRGRRSSKSFTYGAVIEKNPLLEDPIMDLEGRRIAYNSPCIDAGVNVGETKDFAGNPVPSGDAPDIGPFETIMSRK